MGIGAARGRDCGVAASTPCFTKRWVGGALERLDWEWVPGEASAPPTPWGGVCCGSACGWLRGWTLPASRGVGSWRGRDAIGASSSAGAKALAATHPTATHTQSAHARVRQNPAVRAPACAEIVAERRRRDATGGGPLPMSMLSRPRRAEHTGSGGLVPFSTHEYHPTHWSEAVTWLPNSRCGPTCSGKQGSTLAAVYDGAS